MFSEYGLVWWIRWACSTNCWSLYRSHLVFVGCGFSPESDQTTWCSSTGWSYHRAGWTQQGQPREDWGWVLDFPSYNDIHCFVQCLESLHEVFVRHTHSLPSLGLPTLVLPAANQPALLCQAHLWDVPQQNEPVHGERHSHRVELCSESSRAVSVGAAVWDCTWGGDTVSGRSLLVFVSPSFLHISSFQGQSFQAEWHHHWKSNSDQNGHSLHQVMACSVVPWRMWHTWLWCVWSLACPVSVC